MHYSRRRKAGSLPPRIRKAGACAVEGCDEKSYSRERCRKHYDEARRSGEFTAPCAVEGCGLGAVSLGYCASHGQRSRRYGLSAADLAVLDTVEVCDAPGCGNLAQHVDHDHITGDVRGVLCQPCNTSLGLLKDDRDRLHGLILYLDRYTDSLP